MVENRAGLPGPAAAIPAVAPAAHRAAASRAVDIRADIRVDIRAVIQAADTRVVTLARAQGARWASGISTKPRSS
jgi:hypothetical protein